MLEIPWIPYIEAFIRQLVNRFARGVFGSLLVPSVDRNMCIYFSLVLLLCSGE